jgi:hypothetical protein
LAKPQRHRALPRLYNIQVKCHDKSSKNDVATGAQYPSWPGSSRPFTSLFYYTVKYYLFKYIFVEKYLMRLTTWMAGKSAAMTVLIDSVI